MRFGLLVPLLLAAAMLSACREEVADMTPAQVPAAVIVAATPGTDATPRRFVGRLDAVSTVDISFQVGGQLARFDVREGSLVPAGAVLAEIDADAYARALREAELAAALAQGEFDRQRRLLSSNSVSQAAFDQAESDYLRAQIAVETAQDNLDHAQLAAPFDALVTRRLTDNFTNVQAGTPILRIQDLSEMRVRISVPEELVRLVRRPDLFDVKAIVSNGRDYEFPLEYREHVTEPDAVAQTYTVVFGMPVPDAPALLPGMTASVLITPRADAASTLMVPEGAVAPVGEGTFQVWVYDPDSGTVDPREVRLGRIDGDRITVTEGLAPGELVVAAGLHKLQPGMTVRPATAL